MKSIIGKKISTIPQKIIVGGNFTLFNGTSRNRIIRLNSDASVDTEFTIGTGFNSIVTRAAIQSDGKIVIVGSFTSYNGTTQNRITRLNSDGTRDTSFTIGTGFNPGSPVTVNAIQIQSDGKIILGGTFSSYNGTTQNGITRLNSDGTRDTSFTIGTGLGTGGSASALAIQPDGKIVAVGVFLAYNGTAQNRITRLNSDGTRDTGFTVGTGFSNHAVSAVIIQSGDKIIIGGAFTSYNGTARNRIISLNSDGTIDTGFIGSANGNVNTLAVQSDDKILVGGAFTTYNGITKNRILRLNSNRSLDENEFSGVAAGFNSTVNTLAIQSDGKIVVGGIFGTYNGTSTPYICRLNSNGTIDTAFATAVGTGFNTTVNSVTLT